MENNYRNTIYCLKLDNIDKKKKVLNAEIVKKHPKVRIIYNKIKENDGEYKSKFMNIYNYKCSYCGTSVKNIGLNLLEVDHYICESIFKSKEIAGKIENLVLACYDCNRSKRNFVIENKYRDVLNPDLENINDVFFRDDLFYICISDKYKNDAFIKAFYKKLKLDYQTRRLDFLLMNLRGLCDKMQGKPQAEKLYTIIEKLQQKRNITSCKKIVGQAICD